MSGEEADTSAAPNPGPQRSDDLALPARSRDDLDIGWGDEPGERDEDWYRRERPPHHE